MISFDTFLKIRKQFHDKHRTIREIARRFNLAPETVAKWTRQSEYSCAKRHPRRSKLEDFKPTIIDLLHEHGFSAKRIHRHVRNAGYKGGYTILRSFVDRQRSAARLSPNEFWAFGWMRRVMQNNIPLPELQEQFGGRLTPEELLILAKKIRTGGLRVRNKAVAVLAFNQSYSTNMIARFLFLDSKTVSKWRKRFRDGGLAAVWPAKSVNLKSDLPQYHEAVFSILHSPPSAYGFNRSSWRMMDIVSVLRDQGLGLCKDGVLRIIRKAGYQFRKAKKVLTSNDPDYRQKLQEITNILRELKSDEKFFSVDEYGPFAVKMQGGRSRMAPGKFKSVPQYQKSKGSLILTAALELSDNQVTHFYSDHKNTDEMLKLLDILVTEYADKRHIFFSWDGASWHASKRLYRRVEEINSPQYRATHKVPLVKLAPLPSCAQFLNVIESVFSGMAKAIIHNSDYPSVGACKAAIDLYFADRNRQFQQNPKRAGDKIWGKERVPPIFCEANNCKAPN
jgi:transposase